jgi:Lar family restriction alleviation protein
MQKTDDEPLKPCPFCGGIALLTNWGLWRVWCQKCKAASSDFVSKKDAIKAWNKRVSE